MEKQPNKLLLRIKKFQRFHRYLVNLKNKYPRNSLVYPFRFFRLAHVEMALWKYFKQEVKTPLPSPTGSLSSAISSDRIVTANKEVHPVVDTINDGTSLKRGLY